MYLTTSVSPVYLHTHCSYNKKAYNLFYVPRVSLWQHYLGKKQEKEHKSKYTYQTGHKKEERGQMHTNVVNIITYLFNTLVMYVVSDTCRHILPIYGMSF